MPSESPSQGGRRHFHRGRRGNERRAGDRRAGSPQPERQSAEPAAFDSAQGRPFDSGQGKPRGDHVDVEQIMRDIRAKIAQRHGVELTDQQVQELAARRLESILDVRTVKPSLLDQLRKSAGARPDSVAAADRAAKPYDFEDTTLYDSPNGFLRFIRKLLNPILKLFFNPNPLIRALNIQSGLNVEAARREAERDQRQAEWNALHYEILQRLVAEVSKISLEVQNQTLRIESLSTKVDFNERRVRAIEGATQQVRPAAGQGRERERDRDRDRDREREREREAAQVVAAPAITGEASGTARQEPIPSAEPTPAGEGPRRRRRRRRGRRGGGGGAEGIPATATEAAADIEQLEADAGDEDVETIPSDPIVTTGVENVIHNIEVEQVIAVPEPESPPSQATDVATPPLAQAAPEPISSNELAPERVTPQLSHPEPSAREEAAPDVPAPIVPSTEPDTREPQ